MVADNIFRIVLNFLHEIYYTVWVLLLAPIRRQSGFVPESRIFCFVPHKIYLRSWRFITGGLWSKSLNIFSRFTRKILSARRHGSALSRALARALPPVQIPPGATNSNSLKAFAFRLADLCAGRDLNPRRHIAAWFTAKCD